MADVAFKHIKKSYGPTCIVHDFNLHVHDGEFIVLLGPSGCGKSTTLRMLAGLESVTGGELYIDGDYINDLDAKERDLAMVFQSYALYPHMTVYENIAFALKLKGMKKKDIDEKVHQAARMLELEELLARKPKALSGGQRQRVAMGRAMVRTPKVFLFDEPLSNLDAKLRGTMRSEIKDLHRTLKTTTIYVTHDQIEAMTLADRVVILRQGNVEQIGTPEEVFHRPANRFVAQFIGNPSMNLLAAKLVTHEDNWFVQLTKDAALPLPEQFAEQVKGEREVDFGIRPTDIHLRREQIPHPRIHACEVQCLDRELLGANMLLTLELAGQEMIVEAPTSSIETGPLTVYLDLDAVHLFDKQTEQSLLDG